MKVVAFNGSPRQNGNTYNALKFVAKELEEQGIEVEIIQVGSQNIVGCKACNKCAKNRDEKCIMDNDEVNGWIQKMKEADGIILGSAVHFSGITATMKAFLDRAMYVASNNKQMFRYKVGASIVAVRRSGGMIAFDALNNYINYSEMIMPASNYWNVVHGTRAGDVEKDKEGKQIARILGKNMAYLMKMVDEGKKNHEVPEVESKIYTSFVDGLASEKVNK